MNNGVRENPFINRFFWLILLVVAGFTLLPGLGELPIIDRDEPRFSHATVEMMDRGEWAVPYFNDEYRFDKPPLTYWWMRLHFWLGGISEFTARLHSTVSAYLISLIVFGFAWRASKDSWSSLLGAVAWLGSLQVMIHSRLAVADMPMMLFLTLGMWALWEILHQTTSKWGIWFWVFWLSMGLAFLAKGPIALVVVLVAALIHTLWVYWRDREWLDWLNIQPISGVVIAVLIVVAWGLPAQLATDWQYGKEGIGTHIVERGLSAFNGRKSIPLIYYFVSIMVSLLPWASLIPTVLFKQDLSGQRKYKTEDPQFSFFVGWFVAPFLVFTFYKTQLPHYVMPGFPAFFIMLALLPWAQLTTAEGRRGMLRFIFSFAPVLVAAVVGGILVYGSFLFPDIGSLGDLRKGVFWLGAVVLTLGVGSLGLLWYSRITAVISVLLAGVFFGKSAQNLHHAHATPKIVQGVPMEGKKLYGIGYEEPSLIWYSDRVWDFNQEFEDLDLKEESVIVIELKRWKIEGNGKELIRMLKAGESPVEMQFDRTDKLLPKLHKHGRIVKVVQGWNTAQSSWTEVAISYR